MLEKRIKIMTKKTISREIEYNYGDVCKRICLSLFRNSFFGFMIYYGLHNCRPFFMEEKKESKRTEPWFL